MSSTHSVRNHLNLALNQIEGSSDGKEIDFCIELASKSSLIDFCKEIVWQKLYTLTRTVIVKKFWQKFSVPKNELEGFEKFHSAITQLSGQVKQLQNYFIFLDRLSRNASPLTYELYKTHLRSILLSQIPNNFESIVNSFYSRCFRAFNHQEKPTGVSDDDDSADISIEMMSNCPGCDSEPDCCNCNYILITCQTVNREMAELGILEKLSVGMIHTLLLVQIQSHAQKRCTDNFTVSMIENFEKWLQAIIFKWLTIVYGENYVQQDQVRKNFTQFLYHAVSADTHEIHLEGYPESFPAVKDLQECLSRTQLKPFLTESLRSTLETRLLHQGATTEDILIAYVSAIRVFTILDPSGVLLDVACDPIKKYLRNRDDTVRHIIHSLTDSSGDLGGELELGRASAMDDDSGGVNSEGEPSTDWENWMPAPSDADPSQIWSGKKPADIVPMLVSIYGSKSLFVKEYRKLLSDRLLNNLHFDTEEEIRNLEFLKIRFGESELHNCEVMLKDVADSKRINANMLAIPGSSRLKFPISALVVSAQYWDQLKDKPMKLPAKIVEQLDRYDENYKTMKTGRSLHWVPQSGSVELDLEFENSRTVSFIVPPDLATIIVHFEDKEIWSLEELSQEMELPMSHLRRRVHIWQMQGVLVEISSDHFQIDKKGPCFSGQKVLLDSLARVEEEEDDDGEEAEKKSEDDSLQIYWSYVVGMLTNLEALPVERIHQMLKMFTMQGTGGVECTQQQLKAFLDSKVKQQLLTFSSGMYKLPKS